MDLTSFWQAIQGNLISVGIGLCIFIMAYVSNMCFSTYYNVRILGEQFEPSKLKMSVLKILTFGIGTALLTMAITLILPWANQNGLNIPDEYTDVITTVAILGVCLTGSLKYIVEAFSKMGKILNTGTKDIIATETGKTNTFNLKNGDTEPTESTVIDNSVTVS